MAAVPLLLPRKERPCQEPARARYPPLLILIFVRRPCRARRVILVRALPSYRIRTASDGVREGQREGGYDLYLFFRVILRSALHRV